MKITVKLYAGLAKHLPAGARENAVEMDVKGGATPGDVIALLGAPARHCHLVLVNGVFRTPEERGAVALEPGDVLAIWPPVAGG